MKTAFLHLLPPRLHRTLSRLRESIWTDHPTSLEIAAAPPTDAHLPYAERPQDFAVVRDFPHYWGRSFQQRWFSISLQPSDLGEWTHLRWRDRGEATLYVDGHPWGGFDPAHPMVELPRQFSELLVESICCRTGIWVSGESLGIEDQGSRLDGAFLSRRNEAAWTAYHDFQVLWDLLEWTAKLDRDLQYPDLFASPMRVREHWFTINPLVRILVDGLDRATDAYDCSGPEALSEVLREVYARVQGNLAGIRATLTGHAHIDLVWLWPERIGEAKAVHTFANVESLLRKYPEFIFAYSQPASYRAIERRSPELMRTVAKRVAEGRWEPVGALEVESDTHLPCGEALARSLLMGQAEFQRLTGKPSKVVWLPDVFGYSAVLPRLMREAGADFFYTTKLAWSTAERFPYTSFRWRGHDGSEVISHIMGYNQDYNNHGTAENLGNPVRAHRQVHLHPEVLIPTGYGDGGGGPTEEMCERVRRSASLWGLPASSWGRIDAFFERLRPLAPQLPVWEGEMYLEFHRGVFTTHVAVKQTFRALERALQTLEAAHCLSRRGPIDRHFWQRLIFSQFHDDIPGSSIIEVYEEGIAERQALAERALQETRDILQEGTAAGEVTAYFNPLPLPVTQLLGDRQLHLPPLAIREISAACALPETVRHTDHSLQNERCRVEWNDAGSLTRLEFAGQAIPLGQSAGSLQIYPDHPAIFAAWDVDRNSVGLPLPTVGRPQFLGVELSAGTAQARFRQQLTANSRAEFSYLLQAGSPVLRIEVTVDWGDDEMLLRWECSTGFRATTARYGCPYGSITRTQRPGSLQAEAQFEVPASRWMVLGDESEVSALALLSRDRYGFGCFDGTLHCTLLRSAHITEAQTNLPLRNLQYRHTHSDHGRHHFSLALANGSLHAPRSEQPSALADRLFTAPVPLHSKANLECGFLGLEGGESLVPAWAKPAEDGRGWILRLHETRGQRGTAKLRLAPGWQAEKTTLREATNERMAENLSFGPQDLLSVRIFPA